MRIVLMRHGRPDFPLKGWIRAQDLAEFAVRYEASDIQDMPPEEAVGLARNTTRVVGSALRRSLASSKRLGIPDPGQDPVFNETPIPHFSRGGLILPVTAWVVLLRLLWLLGYANNGESLREAKRRATKAAKTLDALAREHESVLLVGHGMMNHLIAMALRKRGWRGPNRPGQGFWGYGIYESDDRPQTGFEFLFRPAGRADIEHTPGHPSDPQILQHLTGTGGQHPYSEVGLVGAAPQEGQREGQLQQRSQLLHADHREGIDPLRPVLGGQLGFRPGRPVSEGPDAAGWIEAGAGDCFEHPANRGFGHALTLFGLLLIRPPGGFGQYREGAEAAPVTESAPTHRRVGTQSGRCATCQQHAGKQNREHPYRSGPEASPFWHLHNLQCHDHLLPGFEACSSVPVGIGRVE
ncbi:MAG: histidine phosphatase family protein [Candidatus Thiodiazotropha sp.]